MGSGQVSDGFLKRPCRRRRQDPPPQSMPLQFAGPLALLINMRPQPGLGDCVCRVNRAGDLHASTRRRHGLGPLGWQGRLLPCGHLSNGASMPFMAFSLRVVRPAGSSPGTSDCRRTFALQGRLLVQVIAAELFPRAWGGVAVPPLLLKVNWHVSCDFSIHVSLRPSIN